MILVVETFSTPTPDYNTYRIETRKAAPKGGFKFGENQQVV
jgi:hypothetical protein